MRRAWWIGLLACPLSASGGLTGSVSLEVVDPDGRAVPSACLTFKGSLDAELRKETDSGGRLSAAGVMPGRYRVEVATGDYATAEVDIRVASDQLTTARIELSPTDQPDPKWARCVVDEDRRGVLSTVPPERYLGPYTMERPEESVRCEGPTGIKAKRGQVQGTITSDARGRLQYGVVRMTRMGTDEIWETRTNSEGVFACLALPTGSYRMDVLVGDEVLLTREDKIKANKRTHFFLQVEPEER